MDSAQETLIAIASASHRVIDASVAYARDKNDRNVNLSRTRLGGELHRIVAASKTLLKEMLQHSSSTDSDIDDRLKNWLSSDEPQACLDSLQTIEKLIGSSSRRVMSTFRNPFRSASTEDKIKDAIRIFEKRRDCFHFLLSTDVWNHETASKGPLRQGLADTLRAIQEVRFPDQDTNTSELAQATRTRWEVDQNQLDEILGWLDAWDCTAKHEDTLELRQPDTCTWLFDSDQYNAWRRTDDSFLWLHGKPGSGKSVLAASVIDDLERTLHEGEVLTFYYCDFRSKRSTAAAEVIRSLLSQLLRGFCDLGVDPGDVLDSLAKERKRNGSILSNAKRLAILVSHAAKRFTRQPLIVVDALDECEDIENLLNALLVLNQGGVRLFVISRPLQVIKDSFSQLPWLSLENMSSEVSADIQLHVRRELDSHRRLRIADATLKEEINWTLCTKADGMFRWIECQLNTLKRCVTTVEIREALESLPIGLDATYEQILLPISREERGGAIVQRALVWLVVAFRPLGLCQIVEALSIDIDRRTLDPDVGPIHGHALLDTLGSLVIYYEETDTVILSHFSVKEYLLGKFAQHKRLYHIDWQDAHAQVARQCMSYIAACLELEQGSSIELYPLLNYVLSSGFIHLGHIKPTRSILDAILALHSDVQQHPLQWERMQMGNLRLDPWHDLPSLEDDFVLFILIRYAPEPLLRLFLGRAAVREKEGTNSLIYAVHGKIEHARTLLSRGAKLDRPGRFITNYGHGCISCLPIEAAIRKGDCVLTDLLLAEGTPVPDHLFSAALLQEGFSIIHQDVVARLLQTDQFVEWATDIHNKGLLLRALDDEMYTRLCWLIEEDTVLMTRRLQQICCDLSGHFIENLVRMAAAVEYISPIEYLLSQLKASLPPDILLDASRRRSSNRAIMHFLLRNGANVHAVSANECTPLHRTMNLNREEEHLLERTRILCEAGSDPSACNLEGKTPMHLAARHGYISVVKYLLSVGALLPPDILLQPTLPCDVSVVPSMIRFLLEKGANATVLAANGDTVLHSALHDYSETWHDYLESARILVAAGCDPGIPNSAGQTVLDIAVASGHIPVVKYLLSVNTPLSSGILLSTEGNSYAICYSPQMIKFLLDNGADIHATTHDGDNALHSCCAATWEAVDPFQSVKILAEAGCDPSAHNYYGETPFHIAAWHGHTKVIEYFLSQDVTLPSDILLFVSYHQTNYQTIQYLIDKGADVCAVDADGNTPLHFGVQSDSESSLECAKILIEAGGDPSVLNSSYETPMHGAAALGYISVISYLLSLLVPLPPDILLTASASHPRSIQVAPVISFLIDKGADVTIVTTNCDTALHLALADGRDKADRLEATKILIGAGCDIHARNSTGETPLYAAARGGHIAVIEHLLSQGASLPPNAFLAAASCANFSNRLQTVRFLATLEGADVHVVASNGDTVLHRTVASGFEDNCLEITKLLIGMGCDPSLRNLAGETPLHISARRNHISIVKYLLSQGIPLPFDVLLSAALQDNDSMFASAMDPMMRFLIREGANPCVVKDNGDTPLHVILRYNTWSLMREWDAIQILLDAGADPYARNQDGQTPVDLAEKAGPLILKNFMRLVKNAKNIPKRDLISNSEMTMSTKP